MTTGKSAEDAVLDDVFSSDRDRGPPPIDQTTTPPPAETPPVAEKQLDLEDAISAVDQTRMVPLSELTSERKKLKAKLEEESRQRIEWETRAKLYQEQAERAAQPPRQQPQQRQIQVPDPYTDPEGYVRFVDAQAANRVFIADLNRSEERVRDKLGDGVVDEAIKAAKAVGLLPGNAFIDANPRHPYQALIDWHKKQKVLETVGDDPDAYRKKIEDELRQKLLEEAKGTTQAGAPPQRFPGTLADQTAAGPQGAHLTEEAAMASVFGTNRKRK